MKEDSLVRSQNEVRKDGFELEPTNLVQNQQIIDENPLAMRIFTHVGTTSTAIQVAWSHPTNF